MISRKKNTSALTLTTKTLGRTRGKNMIALASGKGGVGKTWLAITLATLLAQRGQKILLFDGDFGLANIDIQLGMMSNQDLAAVLMGKAPMNEIITHYEIGGFDVLAGRSGSGALASIPFSRLQLLHDDLSILSTHYDKVIIDLGAGLEKSVRLFAGNVGTVLVLTNDEPTALTDAYAFIKVLSKEYPATDMRILVTSANSVKEGERTYNTLLAACQNFLHIAPPLAGIIRRDNHVKDAIRAQIPLVQLYPACEAVKDVDQIVDTL